MKSFVVLIPTIDKSKDDIIPFLDYLKIDSDTIIANQNNVDETYEILYKGHYIKVICTRSRGISKNRNILLNNFNSDIGLCIDDDCILLDGYEKVIKEFYEEHKDAEAIYFNGLLEDKSSISRNKKNGKITSFKSISRRGAPGLTFTKGLKDRINFKYDESIGYPNLLVCGEDSLFIYDLYYKYKTIFYLNKDIIFYLDPNKTSTWFNTFDDKYFISRGYIIKKMFPKTFFFRMILSAIEFRTEFKKDTTVSFFNIIKRMKQGKKEYLLRR